jgi:hypothetical protein
MIRRLVILPVVIAWTAIAFAQQPPAAPQNPAPGGAGGARQGGGPPGGRGGRGGPPPTARAQAPIDLTGQWVSVVSEDWRWRMTTPQKGDYASVPLNQEGRRVAETWDLSKDAASGEECRPFGAAAVLRLPLRVRIAWQDDSTLKLETDAGQQTRLFKFAPAGAPPITTARAAAGERTWQGESVALWNKVAVSQGLGFGGSRGVAGGNLKVTTTNLRPGYLRKNGVPYSENTVVTEYFNRHDEPNGDSWFTVTTIVDDPKYLQQPFITSSHFKKEADASKWSPTPCLTDVPR